MNDQRVALHRTSHHGGLHRPLLFPCGPLQRNHLLGGRDTPVYPISLRCRPLSLPQDIPLRRALVPLHSVRHLALVLLHLAHRRVVAHQMPRPHTHDCPLLYKVRLHGGRNHTHPVNNS